jgi:high affinity Mn2+ porin
MRYRGLLLSASAALSFPVFAAELTPIKPANPPIFASNPWEGFYLGGHVGYAFGTASYSTNPPGTPSTGGVGLYGQDGQFGPLFGGFQAGYNHVFSSGLMLGAEAVFSFPDKMNSDLPLSFSAVGPSVVNDKIEIFGSLRGRIGYAFGDWLIYGTGGFAYDRDQAMSMDGAGNVDSVYFWRPGFTVGGGVEVRLTQNWSAKLEYAFADFVHAGVNFPNAGERYASSLALHTVQLGLNYRFADDPMGSGPKAGILPNLDDWSIHAQSTVIGMAALPFHSPYVGPNSLNPGFQARDSFSVTGYLGYRAFEGTEFYFNPEPFQGFGLSVTKGLAGFPNNEAQKAGFDYSHYNTARLFLRHVFGFGGEQEDLPDGPNQVAQKADISRLTVTLGKFAIPDIFDNNIYAHDGRSSFMNWALVDAGAFDYAADQKGYTWGAAIELNQKDWALRAGYFLAPDVPNANSFDTRIFQRGEYLLEFEDRYTILGSSGKFRLTGWESQCYCGSFAATLSNPYLSNPLLNMNAPDIAGTRKTRSEFGFVANFEQAITADFGLFARLSWRSGQTEIMAWTDIDESASLGGVLKGTSWGRPNDVIGVAGVINGLSGNYRNFLNQGGLGINIGDGKLSYRPEEIMEAYYTVGFTDWASMSLDYQFIANPGDNSARGPVSIGAVRLHVQF